MDHSSVIEQVKAIAEEIYQTIGSGHSEQVYQKALEVGLRLQGILFEAQKVIELKYRDHYIGEEYLDLIISSGSDKIILEVKADKSRRKLGANEFQQVRNYMTGLSIKRGIIIVFPPPGSEHPVSFHEVPLDASATKAAPGRKRAVHAASKS